MRSLLIALLFVGMLTVGYTVAAPTSPGIANQPVACHGLGLSRRARKANGGWYFGKFWGRVLGSSSC